MISSSLLQSVVELTLNYLVQSTLFLGTVACALLVMHWSQRNLTAAPGRAVGPMIEERLWKLAAVLPFLTVPLSLYAGWSLVLSGGTTQSSSIVATDDDPADVEVEAVDSPQPVTTGEDSFALESPVFEVSVPPTSAGSQTISETVEVPIALRDDSSTDSSTSISESQPISTIVAGPAIVAAQEVIPKNEPVSSTRWYSRLGQAFLCVISLSLIRLIVRGMLIHRFLRQCLPVHANLREMLNRLTAPGRHIRVLRAKADRVTEPFACGIWCWTIVLPDGIEEHLKPAEMRALLAHEVAHLIRRDPLWLFIGEFLCTGLAIQPLNFLARRRWLQSAELLCDDWAVEQNVSATSLATCLTRIAELRLNHRSSTWGLTAVGRAGLLTRRVEWMLRANREVGLKGRRSSYQLTTAVFTLGVLVGTFGPRFVLESPIAAAVETDADAERAAIMNELSVALNELQQTESLLRHDSDPKVVAAAARMRTRVQSIRESLSH